MKTLTIQEVKVSFEVDKKQYQLLIKRDNRRQCIYMVSSENKIVKEGKVKKANPSNCLNDVLKDNNYLRYCDIRTAWSTYYFDKANVDIRPKAPEFTEWEVAVRFRNGSVQNHTFPITNSQGEIMNEFIPTLGLPTSN